MPSSCAHSLGKSFSSHAEPNNTMRIVSLSFVVDGFRYLVADFLELCGNNARDRQSREASERPSSNFGPSLTRTLSSVGVSVTFRLFSLSILSMPPTALDSSLIAAIAVDKPRKAWYGYSKMRHNSSISLLTLSSFSMMKTHIDLEPSSSATSRTMIFRKPRRSSFCSSRNSSPAWISSSLALSFVDTMFSKTRCCASNCRCHSFWVRRHRERKAIFIVPLWPLMPGLTLMTSALMCSSPSLAMS
mmetsp:Transcript_106788/g.308916  ORF Transcript_106788/g.308916 Transcript_106788/m.308916 type:complete len:245 (-) Transcript_106788:1523-2257(-)